MKKILFVCMLGMGGVSRAQTDISQLPVLKHKAVF